MKISVMPHSGPELGFGGKTSITSTKVGNVTFAGYYASGFPLGACVKWL